MSAYCLGSCATAPSLESESTLLIPSAALESSEIGDQAPADLTQDDSLVTILHHPLNDSVSPAAITLEEIELPIVKKLPLPIVDVWERVRAGLGIDLDLENKRIKVQRDWYARHQDYMDRVTERSRRYLYNIVEMIEARDMPLELAMLPIVESAFDPFAYSHGRASGIWQFIPGTGKRFGLKQNWWYDGRRDPVDSTRAALDYLSYLHNRFDGDWLHALAAYNSGEGNVEKAIRRNKKAGKSTEFWFLKLPRETQAYVPKLLALAQLLAKPEFGLNFAAVSNRPVFTTVDVGSQIDLAQAATLADINLDELYRFNSGYNQWATPPEGPHKLHIPVEKAELMRARLQELPAEQRITWTRYTIKNGDNLGLIANRFDTSVATLKTINKLGSSKIRAGKTLFIPTASQMPDSYVLSADQRRLNRQDSGGGNGKSKREHITRSGESFWTISRRYDVGMRQLARWNSMATTDPLRVGQKLVLWTPSAVVSTSVLPLNDREIVRQVTYRVRNGDSLDKIARKFSVTIGQIEAWNKISRKKYLQPGQTLKLNVDITRASL